MYLLLSQSCQLLQLVTMETKRLPCSLLVINANTAESARSENNDQNAAGWENVDVCVNKPKSKVHFQTFQLK